MREHHHHHRHNKPCVLVEPLEPRSYLTVTDPLSSTANDPGPSVAPASVYATFTVAGDPAPPADLQAPSSVTAAPTFGETPGQVQVQWTGSYSGQTGFDVQRSDDGGLTWTTIATADASATSSIDTTFPPNATCYYRVCALADASSGPYTTSAAFVTPPAAPASLTATMSGGVVNLAWPTAAGATKYWIGRSTDGRNFILLAQTTLTTYTDAGGFTAGATYYYAIRGYNDASTLVSVMQPAAVPVTIVPTAPGRLAIDWTNDVLTVTWAAVPGATGYLMQRSPDGSAWTTIATTGSTSADDPTFTPGSPVDYRVIASNAGGDSAPGPALAVTIAATPGALTFDQTRGSLEFWWDDVAGATSYRVERSTDNVNWTVVSPTWGGTWDYDTPPAPGTYYYRVTAWNPGGFSDPGPGCAVTVIAAPPVGPLTAMPGGGGSVTLTWPYDDFPAFYRAERSDDGGATWTLLNVYVNVNEFDDVPPSTPGATYLYRVSAYNWIGDAAPATVAWVLAPSDASGVIATPAAADTAGNPTVTLQWSASYGATSYQVLRSPDGVTWTSLGSTADTSFTDTDVAPNATYHYAVVASNSGGAAAAATTTITLLPPAPTSLRAVATSKSTVALTWTAPPAALRASFTIQISTDGGVTWTNLVVTRRGVTAFTVTGLARATGYWYRVCTNGLTVNSAYSTVATTRTPRYDPPGTPRAFTAVAASATSIQLSWLPGGGDVTGFVLDRSTDGRHWTTLVTLSSATHTYFNTKLTKGVRYYYRLHAFGPAGVSLAPVASAIAAAIAPNRRA